MSPSASPSDRRPFTIDVPQHTLDDLRLRLRNTRWPDQLPDTEWEYGTSLDELRDLVTYWSDEYDWRAAEAELNERSQFLTRLDGEQVHVTTVDSTRDDAVPLILTHGWPGSIVEFHAVIGPLTEPEDPDDPAFHLVIPSLPGYGFSGPTVTPGVDPARIGRMWAQLMVDLGHDRYLAQGGDWGAIVSGHLAAADPEHCAGFHVNMITAPPSKELLDDATPEELATLEDLGRFQAEGTGYQAIQGTRPQTLAYGLTDSPAGLAGWILEKFRAWSDCDGDVFSVHDRDVFCTNLMLYWVTNTAGSSARLYREFNAGGRALASGMAVPMGGAVFPKEIYRASRRWAEAAFDVVHWSTFERGGHFAALEQPDALVADIRTFARTVASLD